jgi:hypothetical protein
VLGDVASLFEVDLDALDARERQLRAEEEEALKVDAERHARELAAKEQADDEAREDARRREIEAGESARRAAEEAARMVAEEAERAAQEEARKRQEEEEARRRQEEDLRIREMAARREKAEKEQRIREEAERRDREETAARARAEAERNAEIKLQKKLAKEEQKARKRAEAEERKRAKEAAKAEAHRAIKAPRQPAKWRKPVAVSAVLSIVAAVGLLHVLQFDSLVPGVERLAASAIGEPVKISSVGGGLFPLPHIKLGGVVVGKEQDIRIASARAVPAWSSFFSDQKVLSELELQSVTVDENALRRIPAWLNPANGKALRTSKVILQDVKLSGTAIALPPFDGDVILDSGGALVKAALRAQDGKLRIGLQNKADHLEAEFAARGWALPVGPRIEFDEISGKAVVQGEQMILSDVNGRLFGGTATGNATLRWGGSWSLAGQFSASQLDLAAALKAFTGQFHATGRLTASGRYAAESASLQGLFIEPTVDAAFKAERGEIDNMDLARALQQAAAGKPVRGGKTQFAEFSGVLKTSGNSVQYRQLALSSGLLLANGSTEVVSTGDVAGRINVELAAKPNPIRALIALSGKLSDLQLKASR